MSSEKISSFEDNQFAFQLRVSQSLDDISERLLQSFSQVDGITEWLSVAAASSDEPISLAERIILANERMRNNDVYSASDLANIRAHGRRILDSSVQI